LSVAEIGILAAAYPAIWAIAQVGTGALSDRTGRKPLIVTGMLLQALALGDACQGRFQLGHPGEVFRVRELRPGVLEGEVAHLAFDAHQPDALEPARPGQ